MFKKVVFLYLALLLAVGFGTIGCSKDDHLEVEEDAPAERKLTELSIDLDTAGLEFDGIGDYVELGFSPYFSANDSFAFEIWLKPLEEIVNSTVLFGSQESHGGAYGFHAHYEGKLSFGVRTVENRDMARVDFLDFEVGEWYHLAGVYNGEERRVYLYVNGRLLGTRDLESDDLAFSNRNLAMNMPHTTHGDSDQRGFTKCIIYEARLWNVMRSQEEVLANMLSKLEGNEPGLIGYWPMDEQEGDVIFDMSINQNHGTIAGASWNTGE